MDEGKGKKKVQDGNRTLDFGFNVWCIWNTALYSARYRDQVYFIFKRILTRLLHSYYYIFDTFMVLFLWV